MKTSIGNVLFIIIALFAAPNLFAKKMTCPPGNQVKLVKLIQAQQDPYDPDYWNFHSTTFTYHQISWNVAFGSFFFDVKTEKEALAKGQAYFDQASLVNLHPQPIIIHKQLLLCDYLPEGRAYYISALSPPETRLY